MLALGQHAEDDVGTGHGLGDGAGRLDAVLRSGGDSGLDDVVARDRVTGRDEVLRHGTSHVAQTDPPDVRHDASLHAVRSAVRARTPSDFFQVLPPYSP